MKKDTEIHDIDKCPVCTFSKTLVIVCIGWIFPMVLCIIFGYGYGKRIERQNHAKVCAGVVSTETWGVSYTIDMSSEPLKIDGCSDAK